MTHINNNQGYHAANLPSFGGKKEPKPEVTHTANECECGCGGSSELRGLDAASAYNLSLVQPKKTEAVGKKGEKYEFDEEKVRKDIRRLNDGKTEGIAIARALMPELIAEYGEERGGEIAIQFAADIAAGPYN